MPKGDHAGRMHGFQLWANLPASLKMTPPRYQEAKSSDIPEVKDDDGTEVRVVCGSFWGKKGPIDGIAADPIYLDVTVPPGRKKSLPVETTRHAFAYVFAGAGKFCNASGPLAVPTEPVGWLDIAAFGSRKSIAPAVRPRGRGYGATWRGRNPLSVGFGKAAARAGSLVRSHRDEHPRAAPAGIHGTPRGHVSQKKEAPKGQSRLVGV
jgi:hypothetical protein